MELSKSIYYSIILDITPDLSHIEKMTLIVFVKYESDRKTVIREHLLVFIPVYDMWRIIYKRSSKTAWRL